MLFDQPAEREEKDDWVGKIIVPDFVWALIHHSVRADDGTQIWIGTIPASQGFSSEKVYASTQGEIQRVGVECSSGHELYN